MNTWQIDPEALAQAQRRLKPRVVRLMGQRNKRPDYRAEAMAALHDSGMTLQQIGNQYGLTRERVRQIINSLTANGG